MVYLLFVSLWEEWVKYLWKTKKRIYTITFIFALIEYIAYVNIQGQYILRILPFMAHFIFVYIWLNKWKTLFKSYLISVILHTIWNVTMYNFPNLGILYMIILSFWVTSIYEENNFN